MHINIQQKQLQPHELGKQHSFLYELYQYIIDQYNDYGYMTKEANFSDVFDIVRRCEVPFMLNMSQAYFREYLQVLSEIDDYRIVFNIPNYNYANTIKEPLESLK